MRKLILILLLFPFIFAGTWSHRVVKTKPNGNVIVEFTRDTGEVVNVTFSRVIGDGTEQLARKKWNLEAIWSTLNNFDIGEDSHEILIKLITAIRNNPTLKAQQAVTWYDTNYPNAVYDGTKLLLKMQNYLGRELGFEPTWDQFKTYVINTKFAEVDSYEP